MGPFRVCHRYCRLVSAYRAKYRIEMGENGPWRPAEEPEDEGIDKHREDRPDCNGEHIRDDYYNTTTTAKRRLRCVDCEDYVVVREPLL